MAECPDGQVSVRMAKYPVGRVPEWPSVRMAECPDGLLTGCQNGRIRWEVIRDLFEASGPQVAMKTILLILTSPP